jgi:hypothetical protein
MHRTTVIGAAGALFLLAGCGSVSTSNPDPIVQSTAPTAAPTSTLESVSDWFTSVTTDYTAVANDYSTISGLSGDNLSGIIAGCSQLDTDVNTLQSDAPIPDLTMNALYQDALTNSAEYATGCVSAATDVSASELEAADQYETKALSDFDQLNGLLKSA